MLTLPKGSGNGYGSIQHMDVRQGTDPEVNAGISPSVNSSGQCKIPKHFYIPIAH